MGLADLTETVEVLCHQMFYRVVGMQKAGVAAVSVCVCVCFRWGQGVLEPPVRCYGCPFMGQFNNGSQILGPMLKSEATLAHKSLTFIFTGIS